MKFYNKKSQIPYSMSREMSIRWRSGVLRAILGESDKKSEINAKCCGYVMRVGLIVGEMDRQQADRSDDDFYQAVVCWASDEFSFME